MAGKATGDAVPAGADDPESPPPHRDFSVGDQVLAEFRGQTYKAKVNKIKLENEEWKYFVHYQGWSTTWDEWLTMTRLKKPTRLNLKKMHDSNKSPNLKMNAAQNKPKPSNRKQTDKKGPVATHDKPKASDENTVKKEGFHDTHAKTKASNGNEVIKNERMPATRTKTKTSHDKRIKKEGLPVTRVKTKALNEKTTDKNRLRHSDNKIKKEGLHATSSKTKTATDCEDKKIKKEELPAPSDGTKNINGEKGKKLEHGSRGEEKDPGPSKRLLKIRFSSFLKKQLSDDEEFITKHDMVVKLPRDPSVDEILKSYLEFMEKKHATNKELDQVMTRGLTEYFNKALPRRLLYIQERQQYEEAIKAEKVSPSSIYGAEHLLRLCVQLPEILDGANMTVEALTQLETNIRDFIEYLQANQQFFLSPTDKYRQAKGK